MFHFPLHFYFKTEGMRQWFVTLHNNWVHLPSKVHEKVLYRVEIKRVMCKEWNRSKIYKCNSLQKQLKIYELQRSVCFHHQSARCSSYPLATRSLSVSVPSLGWLNTQSCKLESFLGMLLAFIPIKLPYLRLPSIPTHRNQGLHLPKAFPSRSQFLLFQRQCSPY